MPLHAFGGNWTEEKLSRLRKYLQAYTKVFDKNERARFLTTHYVDAFAGTGSRVESTDRTWSTITLFDEQDDKANVSTYYQGSARIALEVEPSFDRYLFIEKRAAYAEELHSVVNEYPHLADRVQIVNGDCNTILQSWCGRMDWSKDRAIVFLDPYGMSVDWQTVQILGRAGIGKNGAVDLWVLIPIGQAVNRLLVRDQIPTGAWADRLTSFFGTDEWKNAFYQKRLRPTLFGEAEEFEKQANFESIGDFFIERLKTAFPHVAENSLALLNSRNNPLFLLCFAATNATAVRIANDILKR
jgi:three-Cys-motif partner protein